MQKAFLLAVASSTLCLRVAVAQRRNCKDYNSKAENHLRALGYGPGYTCTAIKESDNCEFQPSSLTIRETTTCPTGKHGLGCAGGRERVAGVD